MALIDPEGLANGERLRACSDLARLWWPMLFLQGNTLGRMEIDYASNILRYGMSKPPTESRYAEMILEYRTNYLLFLYLDKIGATWGQWWAKPNSLPSYKTNPDKATPAPPQEEFVAWCNEYHAIKRQASLERFGSLPASEGAEPGEQPLAAAVLNAVRGFFVAADMAIARQITMAGLAVRPDWKVAEVTSIVRMAYQRNQRSPALFCQTVPDVLRTMAAREEEMASRPAMPEEEPMVGPQLTEEEIARRDRERNQTRFG